MGSVEFVSVNTHTLLETLLAKFNISLNDVTRNYNRIYLKRHFMKLSKNY